MGNMAVLEVLDLSNNLLESAIPAELGLLACCSEHVQENPRMNISVAAQAITGTNVSNSWRKAFHCILLFAC